MNSFCDKRIVSLRRRRLAGVLLYALLLICVGKLFICHTFADFSRYAAFTLALTAIMAILAASAVIAAFSQLQGCVRIYWIVFLLFLLVSYCIHGSGLEYICNTIIFLGIVTVLPYVRLAYDSAVLLGVLYGVYALLVVLFAPRFASDAEALIPLNTNGSGFVLVLLQFCLAAFAGANKKYAWPLYGLIGIAIPFQLQFAGRSSLLGTVLLLVYLLGRRFFDRFSGSLIKALSAGLAAFAVIFAYLYAVVLFDIVGHGNVFFFGKDIFTGRQEIWADAFQQLQGHWLFGIGNSLKSIVVGDDTSGVTNLHNQIMGYLTCFGLTVTLFYIILLAGLTVKVYKSGRRKYTTALLLILIIMSYFDTILYSSNNMVYLPIVLVIVYSCDKQGEEH